jgi:hypothetical protein
MPKARIASPVQTTAGYYITDDLEGHLALVKQQVDRSLLDPETRQLAVKIISGSYDWTEDPRTGRRIQVIEQWGKLFHAPNLQICPPKDDACELAFIWTFLVQNMRYTYDPDSADTFVTLKQSLLAGGGDCDDQTIAICSLARAVGFTGCVARVVSTSGEQWEHVYPIVGCPKDNPQIWIPLDMTVAGKPPGWQVEGVAAHRDFSMTD